MKYLSFILMFFIFFSCSPKKDELADELTGDGVADLCRISGVPPSNLQYANSNLEIKKLEPIDPIIPTYNTGLPVFFRVTPQLPIGLTLNIATGEITGIPVSSQTSRNYEFIITNDCGVSTYAMSITVKEIPPTSISYSTSVFSINIGDNFPTISPTIEGVATSYSITPNLPSGLFFNTEDGTITGKPFDSHQASSYTISVHNSGGSKSTTISIEVKGRAPQNLNYYIPTATYKAGEFIKNNYPLYSGDPATLFVVNRELPQGMSLNSQTGVISGNPEIAIDNSHYVITASNTWGNTSANISLSVLPHINKISTGEEFTCAIKNRSLFCKGKNDKNQLGYATTEMCQDILNDDYPCSREMKPVVKDNAVLKADDLALGLNTSCVLGKDSNVYCWGNNDKGQVGTGLSTPIVGTISNVKFNNENLTAIKEIKAGYNHFCAISVNGDLYCWGDNSQFQLNNAVMLSSNSALLVESGVSKFSLGANHTCVIKEGKPSCVGQNNNGELSLGTNNNASVFSLALKESGIFSNVSDMWLGKDFSIFKENDKVFAAGINNSGELGLLASPSIAEELVGAEYSSVVTGGSPSGGSSICFTNDIGLGFCQGRNDNNFANNQNIGASNSLPLEILEAISVPFTNIDKISQGYSNHRCISRNGELFCFGQNYMGQVSNETKVVEELPVKVIFP